MVITSRLHCALPCLALGTKVLVVQREDDDYKNRISTFEQYFYHCTEEEILQDKVNFCDFTSNKDTYKKLAEDIRNRCENFIKSCRQAVSPELPNTNDFIEYWNRKIEWQRKLYKRQTAINLEELQEAKNWLAAQYDGLTIELKFVRKHSEDQEKYIHELLDLLNEKQEILSNYFVRKLVLLLEKISIIKEKK